MKHLLATAATALLVASGSAALAGSVVPAPADPVVPVPVAPAPIDDWTGFYFGGTLGWAMGTTTDAAGAEFDFDGLLYGGFAGYNYQFDNDFVLGVEAAVSTGELEYDGGATFDPTYIDLKARAGYAMDRALVYVSGGYTFASYDGGAEGGGFNVGAGVDFLVFDNVFVGAEYIYRDLEDTVADPALWEEQFGTIQARVGITF